MKPLCAIILFFAAGVSGQNNNTARPIPGGYELPNGWRITPAGKHVETPDYILNVLPHPSGRALVALSSGANPHTLLVLDPVTLAIRQTLKLKSAFFGLAWSPDGKTLFVSGGNGESNVFPSAATIMAYSYANGALSEKPAAELKHRRPFNELFWSGLAHHPRKPLLYAANRGTEPFGRGEVIAFETGTGKIVAEIPVESQPYAVATDPLGARVYVSNWASNSVSIIDTETNRVAGTVPVGHNPTSMTLARDGRLYVACANENSVFVVDTKKRRATEVIRTSLYPMAPVGSTPDAVALSPSEKMLYVANADNNNVAVVDISQPGQSRVLGFIPAPWYPSALAVSKDGARLLIGSSKGLGSYSNVLGPTSPLEGGGKRRELIHQKQRGSVGYVSLANIRASLARYTRQSIANSPYRDELLGEARPPAAPSIVPSRTGAPSPIRHVIYIIKENRTYDQVYGDMPKGNGDSRLAIFGAKVTPNQHRMAGQFVLLDNLYCDGEVSVDGHAWSDAAYATDYNEKRWPPRYGGHSRAVISLADIPSSGYIWDAAARKGLTYRSYGEAAQRVSEHEIGADRLAPGLAGHVAQKFKLPGMRDTDNVRSFIDEFDAYEKNYESPDASKRLPNFIVMSLGENHTRGTAPGVCTPAACVANNDWAVGMLVERVSHSRYWPETAIFMIEDDAQNGPDHVDARRTAGLVISPYTKRGAVDSTLYSTSSMVRTMELLLGLAPMTQYDAAATPMYASFGTAADLTPYTMVPPEIDVNAKNTATAYGAAQSLAMNFEEYDLAPEQELNEILWKSVKGVDSEMPPPVRRFSFRTASAKAVDKDRR
jgi:YVTN family beta-propeller protein